MNIDLNISIVNTNNRDLLRKCLHSIYKNCGNVFYKIYVLDNASSDGSSEMIMEEFPNVTLFKNKEKLGFIENQNKILRICYKDARYTMMLNEDTELLTKDGFEKMVNFLDLNKKAAAVSPYLLYPDNTPQPVGGDFTNIFLYIMRHTHLKDLLKSTKLRRFLADKILFVIPSKQIKSYLSRYKSNKAEYEKLNVISGACMLMRKEAIDDVGILDSRYKMYSDDEDWCRTAYEKGLECYVINSVQLIHYVQKSISSSSIVEYERSKFKYLRKFKHNRAGMVVLSFIVILSCLIKIVLEFILFILSYRNINKFKELIKIRLKIIKVALLE